MAKSRFQDLRVYCLAEDLGDQVWELVLAWDWFAKDTLGKQIVDAADSIAANIAEGVGRESYRENRRFAIIARGSLYETQHWLRRAHTRNLLTEKQTASFKKLLDELLPRLNAYINSIRKLEQRQKNR